MKTVYTNGILIDGKEDMEPIEGLNIYVNNGKIEEISNDMKEGYQVIDLKGQYIMPGLINMHVHLPASGKPKKKESDPKKLVRILTSNALFRKVCVKICKDAAMTELLSGVTTIRTVGGVKNFDTIVRNQINAGKYIGPHILASDMAVSVEGGHMAGSLAYIAKSAQEASDDVEEIAKNHPDLIKLMITGGVLDAKVRGEPGVLKMPAEYVKAACDTAHRLGLKVAAHVESPEGVRVALENGVDTIEHGATPDEKIIQLFKDRHASLITTLSPALPYALFDQSISHASDDAKYNGQIVFQGIQDNAKACLKHHIPVGLGTDTGCPYITHYDMWRELHYFVKYTEVTPAFALYSATLGNARIAGIDKHTGSIEVGKDADMIVTSHNPLESFETMRTLSYVIIGGHVIKNPQIKKYPEVEKVLDLYI